MADERYEGKPGMFPSYYRLALWFTGGLVYVALILYAGQIIKWCIEIAR